MNNHALPDWEPLLRAARLGDQRALGELLQVHRPLLLLLAHQYLSPDLQAKGGASDLVQDTFTEALCNFNRFAGSSPAELRGWLRSIFEHNVTDFARRFRSTEKRALQLEQPFDSVLLDRLVSDRQADPVAQAIRNETRQTLELARCNLPEEDRQLIHWRVLDKLSFQEICQLLGCTEAAARQRWVRVLERWRHEVHHSHEHRSSPE